MSFSNFIKIFEKVMNIQTTVAIFLLFYHDTKCDEGEKKLLLISIDGFRWDFSKLVKAPNLDWIRENGVTSESVRNVFPSNTIPNHQSIVTGLYPENHGMINNNFYDKNLEKAFDISLNESYWWNQSLPIWIENEMQGKKSGVVYWPGFNVLYNGSLATYTTASEEFRHLPVPYTPGKHPNSMGFPNKIEVALDFLNKTDVNLVALYTEELDSCFHKHGPDKTDLEHEAAINECMLMIDDNLKTVIAAAKLQLNIDVIITGDHGHVNLNSSRVVWIDDYVDLPSDTLVYGYTSVFIYSENASRVYEKLNGVNPHFDVFMNESIPENFHIRKNERSPDLLIVGEPGWLIANRLEKPWYAKNSDKWLVGDHGYSNYVRDMNPGFYAFGPSFKKNFSIPFMELVDIYGLICHLLHINPRKNDGEFSRVKELLVAGV